MRYDPQQPLIIQNDFTILLESEHREFDQVREMLSRFAELIKTPAQIHTYRVTPLSLWNAAASGLHTREIIVFLENYSKFAIPGRVRDDMIKWMDRYGLLKLQQWQGQLVLTTEDQPLLERLIQDSTLQNYWGPRIDAYQVCVKPIFRGVLKQQLIRMGYPVQDIAGYHHGESLSVELRKQTRSGRSFQLRDYQSQAIGSLNRQSDGEGSGVIVLPCGAGKTIVGIGAIANMKCATLILTSNTTSVEQWKRELLDKTCLDEDLIGVYSGNRKEVRPVTIATYQILTHRKNKDDPFTHMRLFNERDWGLIVYDEVHLLPAPVFRVTADIQATRRIGLTATLVREDGREEEVFSLIGPKRYEVSWKEMEKKGWIAAVHCTEVRIEMTESVRQRYETADGRSKFRLAGENEAKLKVIDQILHKHRGEPTIIIGQYLSQLRKISEATGAPLITGELPYDQREILYHRFKTGELQLIVVSKVANFAVDLPDARVAIQVSGSYGSRQEEAQRLGRILRPKNEQNVAYFYTIVSADSKEEQFSLKRQLFLVEQGYHYGIETLNIEGSLCLI